MKERCFYTKTAADRNPELVERVLEAKAPVFNATELAVPLLLRENVSGVIYLKRTVPFEDADFEMVVAISQIASLAIENAFHTEWLQNELKRLEQNLKIESDLLGESAPMNELRRRIARVAPMDTTVLILGESGTGKELVAARGSPQQPGTEAAMLSRSVAPH